MNVSLETGIAYQLKIETQMHWIEWNIRKILNSSSRKWNSKSVQIALKNASIQWNENALILCNGNALIQSGKNALSQYKCKCWISTNYIRKCVNTMQWKCINTI